LEIASKRVYEVLQEKGVETIYHANSVITACQFLRTGSLMSRGTIERKGLYQTPQKSDQTDKQYGIWFDVFADSADIHARAKRANVYGPVLFVIDSELIKNTYTGKMWATKLNSTKWDGTPYEQRWFVSADEFEKNFVRGRFDQMIVFRHCDGELPFKKYLKEIILDDPQLSTSKSKVDYYSMAYGALRLAITEDGIDVKIKKRKCPDNCSCLEYYQSDSDKSEAMFFPKI